MSVSIPVSFRTSGILQLSENGERGTLERAGALEGSRVNPGPGGTKGFYLSRLEGPSLHGGSEKEEEPTNGESG